MVFGYLFTAQADTNPPTNSKSMSQHSFQYKIRDPILDEQIGMLTSGVNTYVPPILGNSYVSWFQLPFFGSNRYQSTN